MEKSMEPSMTLEEVKYIRDSIRQQWDSKFASQTGYTLGDLQINGQVFWAYIVASHGHLVVSWRYEDYKNNDLSHWIDLVYDRLQESVDELAERKHR